MSSPQPAPQPCAAPGLGPAALLHRSDRLELPARAGRAALARLDRLGRPTGPVLEGGSARAQRMWFLLAPGTAEPVPALLGWLGWGPELGLELRAYGAAVLPRQRGVEETPPRPVRWVRTAGPPLGLDLAAPALLRLLDSLAEACARDRMGLAPAR